MPVLPHADCLCAFRRRGRECYDTQHVIREIGGPSCCCAHNIFFPSPPNRSRAAPLTQCDGLIRDVGCVDMLKLRCDREIVDYGLAALMPGLVDLHTHLENSVMRGIVHDVPYTTWITSILEKSAEDGRGRPGTTPPSWAGLRPFQRHHLRCRHHHHGRGLHGHAEAGHALSHLPPRIVSHGQSGASTTPCAWPRTISCTGARSRLPPHHHRHGRRPPCTRAHPSVFGKVSEFARRGTRRWPCTWPATARSSTSSNTARRRSPCTPWTRSAATWRSRRGCPRARRRFATR